MFECVVDDYVDCLVCCVLIGVLNVDGDVLSDDEGVMWFECYVFVMLCGVVVCVGCVLSVLGDGVVYFVLCGCGWGVWWCV